MDFKSLDMVNIVSGFYQGYSGIVEGYLEKHYSRAISYEYEVLIGKKSVFVREEHLEKTN